MLVPSIYLSVKEQQFSDQASWQVPGASRSVKHRLVIEGTLLGRGELREILLCRVTPI